MRTRALQLLCLGEPMYEFNQRPDGLFQGGHGGDTANCAVAAARCGARAGMLTHLGDDQFGQSFLELWSRETVSCDWVRTQAGEQTGVYFVTHDDDGHHFSYRRSGSAAARMGPDDIAAEAIQSTELLHLSGISMAISSSASDAAFAAVEAAKHAGTQVSFDTNLRLNLAPLGRSRALFLEMAGNADILLPGLDDARALTQCEHPDAIVDRFIELGCPLVAMTLGADGALIASETERFSVTGYRVEAIDATGAGDTFDGAFLSHWVEHRDARKAAQFANAAAALSTTKRGAIAAMPDRNAIDQFMASGQ